MLLIDAHLDLAWNALGWNRDLCQEIDIIRDSEREMIGKGRGRNTVSLPELRFEPFDYHLSPLHRAIGFRATRFRQRVHP